MNPQDVTVVVVSYNTQGALRRCLTALRDQELGGVVVVDNDSKDGSPAMVRDEFPEVTLVESGSNLGFSGGNNAGSALVKTPLALFLNSDAYADDGAVARLASVFSDPSVVAAGGRLRNPDGSLQESVAGKLTLGAVFLEQTLLEKLFRHYWRTRTLPTDRPSDVEQVMGACLMLRHGLEPWDERYFLYCEDTDLCRRLKRHGRILYVPDAGFEHELGTSSRKDPWRGIARYNAGKELYFRIHHGILQSAVCFALDRWGAIFRMLLKPKQSLMFWKVLTAKSPI
jgi:N-acetylglucosaminyl-diphospho-decaprenol L-rhamnosyltransferase